MPFPAKTGRDNILAAAVAMIEESGLEGLSMRELGKRLGVRASSLYHHFADRKALEAGLGEQAAVKLHAAMDAAAQRRKGPARLRAMAAAYVEFARRNPALYQMLAEAVSDADGQPASKALWNALLAAVSEVTGKKDPTAAAVAVWAFLHGFVSLERAGKFGASGPKGGLETGLEAILAGLGAKRNIL